MIKFYKLIVVFVMINSTLCAVDKQNATFYRTFQIPGDSITNDSNWETRKFSIIPFTQPIEAPSNTGTKTKAPAWITSFLNTLPDATLNTEVSLTTVNGEMLFRFCDFSYSNFTFVNASTTKSANKKYDIIWGDNTAAFSNTDWSSTTHHYTPGRWTLTYTVTGANPTDVTIKTYSIYVGKKPTVAMGGSIGGTDNCSGRPIFFPISNIENNTTDTRYTVTFNDGSTPTIFDPSKDGNGITHTFIKSSCGTTSYSGTQSFPNSYSANIIAENTCGVSAVSVVPIYVSTAPLVSISSTAKNNSLNKPVCFTNTTTGFVGNGADCHSVPKLVWIISPSSGFTLGPGDLLGNDYQQDISSLWETGSNMICPVFTVPGTYIIKLRVDTKRCGDDQVADTICVEGPFTPQFTKNTDSGCSPVSVTVNNTTDLTRTCHSTCEWDVSYVASNCSQAPAVWQYTNNTKRTSQNPSFNFVTPGTYTLKLSMTNAAGAFSTQQTITVNQPPTVSIVDIPDSCGRAIIHPVALVNACSTTSSPLSYQWSFPGGVPFTVTTNDPGLIRYSSPGSYSATLMVTNNCGSTTTSSNTFVVNPLPVVEDIPDQLVCNGNLSDEIIFKGTNGAEFDWVIDTKNIGLAAAGKGNIAPAIFNNEGDTVLTATLTVTPKMVSTTCVGIPKTFTISVNPSGRMIKPSDKVVIQGSTIPVIKFMSTGKSGTTAFSWTNDSPSIGLPLSGNGDISSFVGVNATDAPLKATVSVTPTFTNANGSINCPGSPVSFSITVNPASQVDTPNDIVLCNGVYTSTIIFSTKNTGDSTTYTWTNSNTDIGLAASGKGNIKSFQVFNHDKNNDVLAIITVTPTYWNAGINNAGTPVSFKITAVPGGYISEQPKSSSICLGAISVPLKVEYQDGIGSGSYQWFSNSIYSVEGGTEISDAITNTFNPPVTDSGINYYYCKVTFTSGACPGITSDIATVAINKAPEILTQPEKIQHLCVGETITVPLTVNYEGGAGKPAFQWFSNTVNSNSDGSPISGANDSTFKPPVFSTSGQYFYYARVTFSGDNCGSAISEVAVIDVVLNPTVVLQPLASQIVCKNMNPDDLIVITDGETGSFKYQWYENSTNNNYTGKVIEGQVKNRFSPPTDFVDTTYYYCEIAHDSLTCKVTSSVSEVIVNLNPVLTKQPISNTVCINETITTLNVSYSGGVGLPDYQWYIKHTSSDSLIAGATKSTFQPITSIVGTTQYYCVLSGFKGGCSSLTSDTANITVNPMPVIASQNISICSGSLFVFTSGKQDILPDGTGYVWTDPIISPTNSIIGSTAQISPTTGISQQLTNTTNNRATAIYRITPTSGSCAGSPFEIVVEVVPVMTPTAIVKNSSCFGANNGSIHLNIVGGKPFVTGVPFTTSWTGPTNYVAATNDISGLVPGVYSLAVGDALGCLATGSFTITEPSELEIKVDEKANVLCNNAANGKIVILATGGTMPYSYTWTKNGLPYAISKDISDLKAGIYVLSVSDSLGCTKNSTPLIITEPNGISIATTQLNIGCYGDATGEITVDVRGGIPLELTPGIFGYQYEWSGPNGFRSTNQNCSNLLAGTYLLSVTDQNGCKKSLPVILIQPDELQINAIPTPITCYGSNNASITAKVTGGTTPYQIHWSNYGTGNVQENLSPGDYTVTVTDAKMCIKSVQITIAEANFSIHPVIKNCSCFGGDNGSIDLNITGGLAPVTMWWKDNPTAGSVRNNLKPGIYTVSMQDRAPCIITKTFVISEPNPIEIRGSITLALNCSNANSGAIKLTVTGGKEPYNFVWSDGSVTRDIANLSAGNYIVTVTDSNRCVQTAQFEISRQKQMILSVTSGIAYDCELKSFNNSYTAYVSGGFSPYHFTWSSGTVSGANHEFMETNRNGIVSLNVTDSLGCTANYTFAIDNPIGMAPLSIQQQLIECSTHTYLFDILNTDPNDQEYSFNWDFGDGGKETKKNPQHSYPAPGTYTVHLIVSNDLCTSSFEQIVVVEAPPKVQLDRLPVLCEGESAVFYASGANFYKWSDGTAGNSINIKQKGNYNVIGISNTCYSDTLYFTVGYFGLINYSIHTDQEEIIPNTKSFHLWSDYIPYSHYFWDFGDGTIDEGADLYHDFKLKTDGYYDVKLRILNPNGCTENASKRIWIAIPEAPKVFDPQGNGGSELFLKDFEIKLYNRNGILMFQGNGGWNGTYNGIMVNAGTYFYVVTYASNTGVKFKTGYVTVVR